jgi:hypothetical protein
MQEDSIQSQGGKARAASLSKEEMKAIAQKAALARWAGRPVRATHKGSFNQELGIDVECYVLDDEKKTAVISQSGMGRTLGLSTGGTAFPRFLDSKAMSGVVGAELGRKLAQPLKFQWGSGGAGGPPTIVNGFDVNVLIDLCQAIVQAEATGNRGERFNRVARQAHIIIGASAKLGITNLVYALAGYSPTVAEVIAAFKLYVQEEAKKYEKEFPNELYEEWYRLYEIPVLKNGKPWEFKHLTVKHIYYPLAKSNGKILELVKALKSKGGDGKKKLFQFLSEVGARALRMHLGRVLEMAESSKTRDEYEFKVNDRFGDQKALAFMKGE